jgi:hypothetical protein
MLGRALRLLPGLWAGLLLCIAALAAPAAFAVLPTSDAGRVVGHVFLREAWISLALAGLLLLGARHAWPVSHSVRSSTLLWGTVVCTALGYFLVQSLMPAARAGQGVLSFGQLHLVSTAFYGLKALLVLILAWRALRV